MKDLNKLQKWAKVIFVITVFFFLGYTFYWIVFMLTIKNYSSADVIGSDYVVMSIFLACVDIVGVFAAVLLRSIWTEETPFLMKNVRWLKLLALALVFQYGVVLMPIILRLDRVMADRKISLNHLAEQVGISNVNLSKIKTGKISAIRFSTLEAICDVLDCQPGDILEFQREEKKPPL